LSYTVLAASWHALYDARLEGGTLDWAYFAQVQQQTGEDWDLPYTLTLSTATLATGLDKPELKPWHVDVYRAPEPRPHAMRAAMQTPGSIGPQSEMMAMAAPPEMAMQKMSYESAAIDTSGPSVTYRITTPRAIPSDGEPHQVAITTTRVDATLDYFCAPKINEHAFVRAKFENTSEYVMLAGPLNLYHGPDYVGTRHMEAIAPGQPVELFLGPEERLKIERKEIEHSVDKNLFGNTARAQLGYRVTIQNPALDTARVTVLDQIPVPQHPDIKVKLRETNPNPTRQNEQGELAWQVELDKGHKAVLEFAVTVEYPKELRVIGL
jgi:uncharacterized protein (TIGR02231 family)